MASSLSASGVLVLLVCVGVVVASTLGGDQEEATTRCAALCTAHRYDYELTAWNKGPCLSDHFPFDVPHYVCDVAHWPRQQVDNDPNNQCRDWNPQGGDKCAFVEVNTKCQVIRVKNFC
eukprot:TRINITY_DN27257_c0_g1_i1.p2 TRINITY_DN27257_c0_g1~~TRINITY_DN27257_c0_g1_i1.p2  ORF type:complete len:127 (+),score=23.03 TRINITY_DN27257_c0_g1_i1:26-382(+)